MGTTWSLKWRGAVGGGSLESKVQALLDAREAEFSNWMADSAVSRFNALESLAWQATPKAVVRAVALARRVAEETDGALDVTVGPLVELWGFGSGGRQDERPSGARIAAVLERCGWQWLEVREESPALRKLRPDLAINMSSVTEGVVMNEVVTELEAMGLTDFLFELGGEVVAWGEAAPGQPWRVGVQVPGGSGGETMEALELRNACLSTAGTYRQRREGADGEPISHILNPRTGQPVAHDLVSVSVHHADCALADAYATALLVMGPVEGRKVAERLGLRVFWIEQTR